MLTKEAQEALKYMADKNFMDQRLHSPTVWCPYCNSYKKIGRPCAPCYIIEKQNKLCKDDILVTNSWRKSHAEYIHKIIIYISEYHLTQEAEEALEYYLQEAAEIALLHT